MTVKLELENGEIKEYKTVCTEYWGDGYTNYDTKCGIRWNSTSSKPESSLVDGCDHLDCAIYASKYDNFKGKHISIIAVTVAVVSFLMDWCDPGELIFLVFIGVLCYLISLSETRESKELAEFMTHGTIGGVRAHQIYENSKREAEIESIKERVGGLRYW